MNRLFAVTFRADTSRGGQDKSDHEVVLLAENEEEARQRAEEFFSAKGGYLVRWVPNGFGGVTHVAGTAPRFVGITELPTCVVIYNGKIDKNAP